MDTAFFRPNSGPTSLTFEMLKLVTPLHCFQTLAQDSERGSNLLMAAQRSFYSTSTSFVSCYLVGLDA